MNLFDFNCGTLTVVSDLLLSTVKSMTSHDALLNAAAELQTFANCCS